MSPRRPLLRLEEKLAAEDRLLASLPVPRRWRLIVVAAGAALTGHAAFLALPGFDLEGPRGRDAAERSMPVVWRGIPEPSEVAAPAAKGASPAARVAPSLAVDETDDAVTEPVPEPLPAPRLDPLPLEAQALIGDAMAPPAPEEPAPAATETVRSARLIPDSRVEPIMPAAARTLRAGGSVSLALTVGADGRVVSAEVLSCTRPGIGFEKAAVDAALRWRYEPAMRDGQPVPSGVTVRVEFTW